MQMIVLIHSTAVNNTATWQCENQLKIILRMCTIEEQKCIVNRVLYKTMKFTVFLCLPDLHNVYNLKESRALFTQFWSSRSAIFFIDYWIHMIGSFTGTVAFSSQSRKWITLTDFTSSFINVLGL